MSRQRKVVVFVAITFVASWTLAVSFAALGVRWGTPAAAALAMLFVMPPAFAALVVAGPLAKESVMEQLGLRLRPNRWWLVAWLLPAALVGLTVVIGAAMPGASLDTSLEGFVAFYGEHVPAEHMAELERQARESAAAGFHPLLRMAVQAMVAGASLNAVVALGEELGWRGLLHHALASGFWRRSTTVGLIWGVWYAPLVVMGHNYPDHPAAGVPLMVAWCVLMSPSIAYVRERSGSVLAAGVLHGTLNALAGLPPIATRGGSDLTTGVTGAAGFVAAAIVLVVLLAHDRYVAAERIAV